MVPELLGTTPWKIFWWSGAIAGSLLNLVVLRRRGIDPRRAVVALALAGAVGFLGARLEWVLENGVPLRELPSVPGARMPGGFLGFLIALPPLLRSLRLPIGRFLDGITPGTGLAIAIGRIGCFLQGCCFGTRSDLPWAIRFPHGSPAWESHRILGWVPPDATASLPVHPLELYFALDGLAIMAAMLWLLPRLRYDGQGLLAFFVLRCWSKVGLEHLRGREFGAAPNASGEVEWWIAVAASITLVAIAVARAAALRPPPGVAIDRGADVTP